MIDNNKANAYAAEAMYHCVDMQKLLAFLSSAATHKACEITEYEVHGAISCLKANDKLLIERNIYLSDMQKEAKKLALDESYDRLYMDFIKGFHQSCNVRIVKG